VAKKLLQNNPERGGLGKYALIRLDKLPPPLIAAIAISPDRRAMLLHAILQDPDVVEFGPPFSEGEFFTIKLKDRCSLPALAAYADHARGIGLHDLADEVEALAGRAGNLNPNCKNPD
jgi:hypothetical protein